MDEIHQINKLSKLGLGDGRTLRNRIVVPPMASQTSDEGGFVTNDTLTHYGRLAEAGAGLLIVEYTFVHPSGRSEKNQLGISSDAHVAGLTKLATLIKQSGILAGLQITHSGGKTERHLTGGVLMGPSSIAVPVKDRELERPTSMTGAEIELWKQSFLDAIDRAVLAGFDLIELHSAHGYGLNQWLSPITNHREDEYGRNQMGRMKLALEIVCLVRARHPDLLISVRIPGQDFMEGGLSTTDMTMFARCLEKSGTNIIHVSSGIGGWRRPAIRIGEGYLVEEAATIQSVVTVPVIGVGGIETGAFIDNGLQRRRFALAAVGRAILKDPIGWRSRELDGAPLYSFAGEAQ